MQQLQHTHLSVDTMLESAPPECEDVGHNAWGNAALCGLMGVPPVNSATPPAKGAASPWWADTLQPDDVCTEHPLGLPTPFMSHFAMLGRIHDDDDIPGPLDEYDLAPTAVLRAQAAEALNTIRSHASTAFESVALRVMAEPAEPTIQKGALAYTLEEAGKKMGDALAVAMLTLALPHGGPTAAILGPIVGKAAGKAATRSAVATLNAILSTDRTTFDEHIKHEFVMGMAVMTQRTYGDLAIDAHAMIDRETLKTILRTYDHTDPVEFFYSTRDEIVAAFFDYMGHADPGGQVGGHPMPDRDCMVRVEARMDLADGSITWGPEATVGALVTQETADSLANVPVGNISYELRLRQYGRPPTDDGLAPWLQELPPGTLSFIHTTRGITDTRGTSANDRLQIIGYHHAKDPAAAAGRAALDELISAGGSLAALGIRCVPNENPGPYGEEVQS